MHAKQLIEQQNVGLAGVENLGHGGVAQHGEQRLQPGGHVGLQRQRVDKIYLLAVKYLNQGQVAAVAVAIIVKLQVDADARQRGQLAGQLGYLGRRSKVLY
ncbi:MAG: hypothetical protein EOO62_21675 [Hymenobacter sp.]|nr:MAG: hypothetical protein EOO62_21675 [Hymenobacter sp.]